MAACESCGTPLPAEARFCSSCGASVETAPPATEERKVATVLFADLVGSTELGEQDPERTRALLHRFYDAMAAEIERAGGTVEKFAGDAVMAAFGAPAAQEDHAERALHTALSMQHKLGELFGDELSLRIGVNTGEVVVGKAREGSSFVTGDAVNVAARLEQNAAPGEILAGERTAAAVRGAFEFDQSHTVEAKGKTGGVTAQSVVRALSLMRPRGIGGLQSVFIGRDAELAQLHADYLEAAAREEPHLVTIVGDAGVGKTRLVRELWQLLDAEAVEPLRLTGRCLAYGRGVTYWPLAEVLREQLDLLESDSEEEVRRRLGQREILGLTLGLDVAGDLHPLAARDRLQQTWVELVEELAAERPLVLLVEDLHWAEDPLLDLLERLHRDVQAPFLLVTTARPEFVERRPGWGSRRGSATLWLDPLGEGDAERLVEGLLAAELPDPIRRLVVERAEGNPFFAEEVLATLIDRGVLRRMNGGWRASELPQGFAVPDSVQAVIAARIDLLEPGEKEALQAAAVVGRVFWPSAVYELTPGFQPDLRLLEDRDLIRRHRKSSLAGDREYAFKHALTRDVAYTSIPKAKRARLHAAFAEWVETTGAGRDEQAAFLAHHYSEAVKPEDADLAWTGEEAELERLRGKAVDWLERAAELAAGRYALDEATALLERALELEDGRRRQARLWHALGRAHALKFDGEQFWAAMEKAIELCDEDALRADLYADLALETVGRMGMWPILPERELVEGWIERALELAKPESVARAKALVARSSWVRSWGDADNRGAAVDASALAERVGDADLRAVARMTVFGSAFFSGDYEEASGLAERSFELIGEVKDPSIAADIHFSGTLCFVAQGRFQEARRLADLHDELTAKLTPHHRVHGVGVLLEVEELAGNWKRIAELEERTLETVDENVATPCIRNPRSVLLCAIAAQYAGDSERARRLEERAQDVWMEGYGIVLDAPQIRLALAHRDLERVEQLVRQPVVSRISTYFGMSAVANRLDALVALGDRDEVEVMTPPLLRAGTYLEPFALRALGQVREDEELIRRALERFEAMQLDWHAEQTRALL